MRAVRVTVRGGVQGVGFRWFTRDTASAHGVSGWVRNRRDGTVEAHLQGADASIDAVLVLLRQGPPYGRVDELSTSDAPPGPSLSGFEIRATV